MKHPTLSKALAVVAGAAIAGVVFWAPLPALADDNGRGATGHAHDTTDIWAIARGGRLYDNWMSETEADDPKGTHPAYPSAGKKKGKSTWRCKECHGWDAMGRDGAYAKGSHFTGIKGIRARAGDPPEKLHDVIMNKTHGFTKQMISHSAMEKLALFISKGQIDMDKVIDRKTKKPKNANVGRGAAFFQTICANCHGMDGRDINFKNPPKVEYVGTVAKKNPWETLHKIRYGQPGTPMPSLIMLPMKDLLDILAYTQTLPSK